MADFRRYIFPNTAYFVTTNVFERRAIFADPHLCNLLITCLGWCRKTMEFALLAYVVMPDHLHLILAPSEKTSLPDIMRRFKSYTGRVIGEELKSSGGIWQPRYYDHALRDRSGLLKTIEYVHHNPVAAGLVESSGSYKFSSYQAYFRPGREMLSIDASWIDGVATPQAGQEPRPTMVGE